MSDVRPAASGIKVQETHTTASEDTSPLGHREHSGEAAFQNATLRRNDMACNSHLQQLATSPEYELGFQLWIDSS